MDPRICLSLFAISLSELDLLIHEAIKTNVDLLEIRLDYMTDTSSTVMSDLETLVSECKIPLVATNRKLEEGGHHAQAEKVRKRSLAKAAEIGFQYVDVELSTTELGRVVANLKDYGATPIISLHNFEGTPPLAELKEIIKKQIKEGAKICKLITTAQTLSDNLKCLQLVSEVCRSTKIVSFAMGKKGRLSRILSPFFGGEFTYASLKDGLEAASGQISISDLRKIYHELAVI